MGFRRQQWNRTALSLVEGGVAAGLGIQYVKDIKAPFPHIPVIPTGGVSLENVASFIQAGAAVVGVGGNLLDRNAIAAADFTAITAIARRYVETIRQARG